MAHKKTTAEPEAPEPQQAALTPEPGEPGGLIDDLGLSDAVEPEPEGTPAVQDTTAAPEPQPELQPETAPTPTRDAQGRFVAQGQSEPGLAPEPQPEPEPEPEVDWRARAQAAEQQLAAQQQGFQRTISGLRDSLRQQPLPSPEAQPQAPAPQQHPHQQGLPIQFDEQGQPFVPVEAMQQFVQQQAQAQAPQPASPEQLRRARLGQIQQAFINTDPVQNAGPTNVVFDAVETANTLLAAKQAELGGYQFRGAEDMVEFMEQTGISGALRQQYPWLRDEASVETLVEATLTMSPRKFGRLVESARGVAAPLAAPQPATPSAPPRVQQLPAQKPRSQANRGGPQPQATNREQRLAYLDGKDPMDLTEAEAKELEGYLRPA